MKKILLAGQKGGTGKSFLARALVVFLVNKGYKVLMSDLDVQLTNNYWSLERHNHSIISEVDTDLNLNELINIDFTFVPFDDYIKKASIYDLEYDFLIVDSSGKIESNIKQYYKFDLIVSPIVLGYSCLLTLKNMFSSFLEIKKRYRSNTKIHFVFNKIKNLVYPKYISEFEEANNYFLYLKKDFDNPDFISLGKHYLRYSNYYGDYGFDVGKVSLDYKQKKYIKTNTALNCICEELLTLL